MNVSGFSAAPPSEGESNTSSRRRDWSDRNLSETARRELAEDAGLFLHQSISSPCLAPIAKAEGPWIEDTDGRRYFDFHGNNVHHIGYGHPRLKQAIAVASGSDWKGHTDDIDPR